MDKKSYVPNNHMVNKFIKDIIRDDDYKFLLKSFIQSVVRGKDLFEGELKYNHNEQSLIMLNEICDILKYTEVVNNDDKKEFINELVNVDLPKAIKDISDDIEKYESTGITI